ncbi:MerR family transcriptional regulator [Alicyclobacillus tolerans]|uniref:MerR family transcriptional regulator n=1 Tax=Alicyclobacillus tolerans TaxID=90970 RepID=UPI001A97823E|nr:MerR family transcriptional regulator [Alicyclobacillus montanus]
MIKLNDWIQTFSSSQVAQQIDVKTVTLRAWCKYLENEFDYKIMRDDQGNRMFTEVDISALRKFKEYMEKNLGWEKAAELVVREFSDRLSVVDKNVDDANIDLIETINSIQKELENQQLFNQELVRLLDEREKSFEEKLKRIITPLHLQLETSHEEKQLILEKHEKIKMELIGKIDFLQKEYEKKDELKHRYIEESLKRRDEELLKILRTIQENTERELAATKRKKFLGLF